MSNVQVRIIKCLTQWIKELSEYDFLYSPKNGLLFFEMYEMYTVIFHYKVYIVDNKMGSIRKWIGIH